MKLIHIKGNTYYTDIAGTATGIYYFSDQEIAMIDSGGSYSRELFSWLRKEKLTVKTVIHTHIHEDHVANSDELQDRHGALLYARKADIEFPEKFLEHTMTANKGTIRLYGKTFRTIPTPGHTPGHQLVITPDDVCFLGDTLITEDVLNKTKLPYEYDALGFLKSHSIVAETKADRYIASHLGEVKEADIPSLIEINQKKQQDMYDGILIHTEPGKAAKDIAFDYLIDIGVRESTIRRNYWIIEMVKDRIYEMAFEGRIKIKNGRVI